MIEYEYHPISQLFPKMETDKLGELAEDIKTNGLRHPIILFENKILDGRNRYEACKMVGIEPTIETYEGTTPASLVASENLRRRDLTASQRAAVTVNFLPWFEKEAKKSQSEAGGDKKSIKSLGGNVSPKRSDKEKRDETKRSRTQASKQFKSNEKYVQKLKIIKNQAPEVFEQVFDGKIDIKQAEAVISKQKEEKRQDTSNIIIPTFSIPNIHNCDIADAPIDDDSINTIVTDPPYLIDYLDVWGKLASFAAKKLKPGGSLITMAWQPYLDEIFSRMKVDGLSFYWIGVIKFSNNSATFVRRTNTFWKPYLWFVKGEYDETLRYRDTDVLDLHDFKEDQAAKKEHKWGQSLTLVETMVKMYSAAGDTICDPFLGSGTTAIACHNLKRKFVGIELDKESYNKALQRITKETKNNE